MSLLESVLLKRITRRIIGSFQSMWPPKLLTAPPTINQIGQCTFVLSRSSLNCRRGRADPHQCQWHDNGMTIGPRISSRAEPSNHACLRLDETAIIADEERKYKFLKEKEYKHQR